MVGIHHTFDLLDQSKMGGGIFDFERFYGFLVFFGIQRLETCACLTEIHGDSFTAKGWCFGSTTSQRHAAERDGCHPTPMWFGDVSGPRNLDASASNDLSHDKLWMVRSMYHQLLHQNLLLRLIPCFVHIQLIPRSVGLSSRIKPNRKKKDTWPREILHQVYEQTSRNAAASRLFTRLDISFPSGLARCKSSTSSTYAKISKTWCWCPFFCRKLGHSKNKHESSCF